MNPEQVEPKPSSNTELMLESFATVRSTISEWRTLLNNMEQLGSDSETIQCFREGIFCFELGMTYYTEANLAIQAEAWFAGSAVAAAALEAVLMAKCLFDPDKVRALPKWKTIKKSYRDNFGLFVRSLDLGKLLEIAEPLGWFPEGGLPTGFETRFSISVGEPAIQFLREIFRDERNVGEVCAAHVREYRNLLHPAVCLKEARQPSKETGLMATLLFLIAFSALAQ